MEWLYTRVKFADIRSNLKKKSPFEIKATCNNFVFINSHTTHVF